MEKQIWFNRIFICIRLVVYILIIYVTFRLINNNTRILCFWNERYGILCPSCGATRATLSILKGDILKAFNYNLVYTISIFPLACIFIIEDVIMMLLRILKITKKRSLLETFFDIEEVTSD